MAKFFVDAFADIFGKELEKNNLILAPSKIKKGNKIINFQGYDENIKPDENLIKEIKAGKYKIVPLTQKEWTNFFEPYAKQGEDIIFFSISHELMADGGADLKAAFTELDERYPDVRIELINTLTISRGTSDIAKLTAALYKKTKDFSKAVSFASALAGQFVTAFVVDDVEYLGKNPIVDQVKDAFNGSLINMKPIVSINTEGKVDLFERVKGFKSAVAKLYTVVTQNGENIADFTFTVASLNADAEAKKLYEHFLEKVEPEEISMCNISLNNAIIVGGKCVALTFHAKTTEN